MCLPQYSKWVCFLLTALALCCAVVLSVERLKSIIKSRPLLLATSKFSGFCSCLLTRAYILISCIFLLVFRGWEATSSSAQGWLLALCSGMAGLEAPCRGLNPGQFGARQILLDGPCSAVLYFSYH